MVDGCKKVTRVIVVDLDGTLVNVNTFREYLLFTAKVLTGRLRFLPVIRIMISVAMRKLRLVSHSAMKRRVLAATQSLVSGDDIDSFVRQLLQKVNIDLLNMLEKYRKEGCKILLATAAPGLYAREFADSLHLDGCVATPEVADNASWRENVGTAKLDSVCDYISGIGGELAVVVTDHYDDLPLLRYNPGVNILVNPSPATVERLTFAQVPFDIL